MVLTRGFHLIELFYYEWEIDAIVQLSAKLSSEQSFTFVEEVYYSEGVFSSFSVAVAFLSTDARLVQESKAFFHAGGDIHIAVPQLSGPGSLSGLSLSMWFRTTGTLASTLFSYGNMQQSISDQGSVVYGQPAGSIEGGISENGEV